MKKTLFLVFCLLGFACSKFSNEQAVIENKKGLDLETITFKEDPLALLKNKIDSTQNVDTDFVKKGYSAPFDYPKGYKFEPWNGDESLYGKAYYSKEIDSIARYKDLYFNSMAFLTHNNKVVGVLAYALVPSDTIYTKFKNKLQEDFGEPSFDPQTDQDEFYEFFTGDRYIQIDYSEEGSVSFSTDGTMKSEINYKIKVVIFNKEAADEIKKIQDANYKKTGSYKILYGDFQLYKHDPNRNIVMMSEIYDGTYNP